jgi:transglutaminase-like putative cysteine protease
VRRVVLTALLAASLAAPAPAGEQIGRYRASGRDAGLFEQYDNDGYSLQVSAGADGALDLTVRVSDAPLVSAAPFPTGTPRDPKLPAAPERDAFALRAVAQSRTQIDAVRRVLLAVAAGVRYDPDHTRRQDPDAVFASRQAYCVGFAELAVDLLRRAGITARTVQGILRTEPDNPAFDAAIEGAYHRWIEVYYPDRGFVFSDPRQSINGVDARYIAFTSHALLRPKALEVRLASFEGELKYDPVRSGDTTVRVRAVEAAARRGRE